MKDKVREAGTFKPTTAVIRANKRGDYIVSSISIRDRLIKICTSSGIKRIIVIYPSAVDQTSYIEHANEKSATVENIGPSDHLTISGREIPVFIEDGFLVHTSLLDEFLASDTRILINLSSGRSLFSKDSFDDQAKTTYPRNKIFSVDPFHIIEIENDNNREARSRLFKWLNKKTDGFVSKTLNRPISTIFSKFFAEYPIPPLYFTAVTAVLALLMTYVLIKGGESGILWGCILFHVVSVVDGIDGEIARAKFLTSLKGAKLDTTVDMITNILFMGGMSYALWTTYGDAYLTLGISIVALALMGVLLMTALLYFGPGGGRFDILATTIRERFTDRPVLMKIFNFCNYFLKRDAFAFIFAVYGLLGLGRYIPEFLIFGLAVWNLAIILSAKSILKSEQVTSGI